MNRPAYGGRGGHGPALQWLAKAVVLLAITACIGSSTRANGMSLGPPTNAMQTYDPLGNWRHVGLPLRQHGKPVFLFVGTKFEESAPMRWPIVKALTQFGKFHGLAPDTRAACGGPGSAAIPTFDWLHARYQSPYVLFDHKELYGYRGERLQKLSSWEAALFRRYVGSLPGTGCTAIFAIHTRLPLMSTGGYLLLGADPGLGQDLFDQGSANGAEQQPLSFGAIQAALRSQPTNPSDPAAFVATNINDETNIITALICHADGRRPTRVCARPVIRQLLRHIT